MWPLGVLLLVSLMPPGQDANRAQSIPQIPMPYYLGPAPEFRFTPPSFHFKMVHKDVPRDANICYAIRSYIFVREDSHAPVLVKTMTCTPSSVLMERRVSPMPARLVPASSDH